MNCIADQPSRSPSPNRSSMSGPCALIPIASITAGTKARMPSGSASLTGSPPCRSIAASIPHGTSMALAPASPVTCRVPPASETDVAPSATAGAESAAAATEQAASRRRWIDRAVPMPITS